MVLIFLSGGSFHSGLKRLVNLSSTIRMPLLYLNSYPPGFRGPILYSNLVLVQLDWEQPIFMGIVSSFPLSSSVFSGGLAGLF